MLYVCSYAFAQQHFDGVAPVGLGTILISSPHDLSFVNKLHLLAQFLIHGGYDADFGVGRKFKVVFKASKRFPQVKTTKHISLGMVCQKGTGLI